MAEATVKIHEDEGKPNISEEVKSELWDIHRALFGVVGALRMIRNSALYSDSEDLIQTAGDITEVSAQYAGIVKNLQDRLDAAICKLK